MLDQISLQIYYFMQTPWSKVAFAALFVVLIIWGIGATRQHAYHYAMKGARFGATSSLITLLVMLGLFAYVFVDKSTLSEIFTGKRPVSELPHLAEATLNRFKFVLGASTDSATSDKELTADQVMAQISNLSPEERQKLGLQMCRQLLQQLPSR